MIDLLSVEFQMVTKPPIRLTNDLTDDEKVCTKKELRPTPPLFLGTYPTLMHAVVREVPDERGWTTLAP